MIKIPQHIKALIFDLDGTLVDSMPLHYQAWTDAGREFGVEITPFMINAMAGVPTIQSVVKLNEIYGWDLDPMQVKMYKDLHYRRLKQVQGKYQTIGPVFDIVKANHGVRPMAVGTGSARLHAIETLRDLEIIDWFEAVVAADDVESHKPFPDTFLQCAQKMQVAPSSCMVFEDGEMGILAAKNAGMQVVNITEYL